MRKIIGWGLIWLAGSTYVLVSLFGAVAEHGWQNVLLGLICMLALIGTAALGGYILLPGDRGDDDKR